MFLYPGETKVDFFLKFQTRFRIIFKTYEGGEQVMVFVVVHLEL